MLKLIGFYISIDAILRSFNILSLIFIIPLVSQSAQELITYYTVTFSLLTAIFSLSQLALVPRTARFIDGRIVLDLSVFSVGVSLLIVFLVCGYLLGRPWFGYACISAMGTFLYQSYQAGNNIHVRLKDLAVADLIWLFSTVSILTLLFLMEVNDERLRVFSHLGALVFVSIFILNRVKFFSPPQMAKSSIRNAKLGIWMTIYSGFQWFLVYGDKMLLGAFNQETVMVAIFTMTNILQLQLLGSLALVKAFKAKLLQSIENFDMKALYILGAWHISLSLLGSVICGLLYFTYARWLDVDLVSYNYIITYIMLYFSLGLTYFIYQVIVFIDEQKTVSFGLLIYGLPLTFSVALTTWLTNDYFFIPLGFFIVSLFVLGFSTKVALNNLRTVDIGA